MDRMGRVQNTSLRRPTRKTNFDPTTKCVAGRVVDPFGQASRTLLGAQRADTRPARGNRSAKKARTVRESHGVPSAGRREAQEGQGDCHRGKGGLPHRDCDSVCDRDRALGGGNLGRKGRRRPPLGLEADVDLSPSSSSSLAKTRSTLSGFTWAMTATRTLPLRWRSTRLRRGPPCPSTSSP